MPAHGITAVAIKVQQHAVESATGFRLDLVSKRCNVAVPRFGTVLVARIGVADARVALEGDLSRLDDSSSEHGDRSCLPERFADQVRKQFVCKRSLDEVVDVNQLTARRQRLDTTVTWN